MLRDNYLIVPSFDISKLHRNSKCFLNCIDYKCYIILFKLRHIFVPCIKVIQMIKCILKQGKLAIIAINVRYVLHIVRQRKELHLLTVI